MKKYNLIKLGLLTLCIAISQSRSAETVYGKFTTMAGIKMEGEVEFVEDGLFRLPGEWCFRILLGLEPVKTLEECRNAMEQGADLTAVFHESADFHESAEISTWPFQTQCNIDAEHPPFKNVEGLRQAERLVEILNAAQLTYEGVKTTLKPDCTWPIAQGDPDGKNIKQWCFGITLVYGEYGEDMSGYTVEMGRARNQLLFTLVYRSEGWFMRRWGTRDLVRMPEFVLAQISSITPPNRFVRRR